jgi:flagellar biosynthesis protein FlhG
VTRRRLGRGLYDLGASPFAAPSTNPREVTVIQDEAAARVPRPVVICVTSGKGGTGKSVLTSNLAVHMAASGLKVIAVDADMGLANLHLLLGLQPRRTVMEVIESGATIDDVAETGPVGVRLAGGGSGRPEMADLHPSRLRRLVAAVDAVGDRADVVLVDTGAGIGRATTSFLYAIGEILVVTSPDLTAMTDGYAVIKNVLRNNRTARVFVVVNRAQSAVEGLEVFGRIDRVCRRFMERRLFYLGHVLNDPRVTTSVAARLPILLNQPAAPASACLRGVGRALLLEIDRRLSGRDDGGRDAATAAAPFDPDRGPACA